MSGHAGVATRSSAVVTAGRHERLVLCLYRGAALFALCAGVLVLQDSLRNQDEWFVEFLAVFASGAVGLGLLNLLASTYRLTARPLLLAAAGVNVLLLAQVLWPWPDQQVVLTLLIALAGLSLLLLRITTHAEVVIPHAGSRSETRSRIVETCYVTDVLLVLGFGVAGIVLSTWPREVNNQTGGLLLSSLVVFSVLNGANVRYGRILRGILVALVPFNILTSAVWWWALEPIEGFDEWCLLSALLAATGCSFAWLARHHPHARLPRERRVHPATHLPAVGGR